MIEYGKMTYHFFDDRIGLSDGLFKDAWLAPNPRKRVTLELEVDKKVIRFKDILLIDNCLCNLEVHYMRDNQKDPIKP